MAWFAIAAGLSELDKRLQKDFEDDKPSKINRTRTDRTAAPQRVAHQVEEGYKERYVPSQGWVHVVPDCIYPVSLRLLGGSPGDTDEIILAAEMTSGENSTKDCFEIRVHRGETAADVEKRIWRMKRIGRAAVAIELVDPDGAVLPADALVMESFPIHAYFVTLRFLRRCSDNEVILVAATLSDTFEICVNHSMLVKDVAMNLQTERGLDASVVVKLIGLDGMPLPLHEPMLKCLSIESHFEDLSHAVAIGAAVVESTNHTETGVSKELSRSLSKHLSTDLSRHLSRDLSASPKNKAAKPGVLGLLQVLASRVCCAKCLTQD